MNKKTIKYLLKNLLLTTKNIDDFNIVYFDLKNRYSEYNRIYHNINHIYDCLYQLEQFILSNSFIFKENEISLLKLSIIFHDIIYDVISSKNEDLSATYSTLVLNRLSYDYNSINIIAKIILSTKDYKDGYDIKNSYNNLSDIDRLCHIIRDIDLSILGAESLKFKEYSNLIKAEYSIYNKNMMTIGRIDFLQSILNMKRIYVNDYFFNLFEKKSRENILNELNELKMK